MPEKPKKKDKHQPVSSGMVPITDPILNVANPTAEVAAKNPDHPAVIEERSIETILNNILSGNPLENPIVLGTRNGKPFFKEVKIEPGEDGRAYIEDFKPKKDDLKKRQRMAEKIIEKIQPVLRKDIGTVAYMALTRKPLNHLKNMYREIKKDAKNVKLSNRVGCIFLEVGDLTTQI